jgi:methyl-accepting chemotaxis protein
MSSTAEELASQAEQLQATISYFRVDDRQARAVASVGQRRVAPAVSAAKPVKIADTGRRSATKTIGSGIALEMNGDADELDSEFGRANAA